MQNEVTKQKNEYVQKNKEIRDLATQAEKDLLEIIDKSNNILKSNDATSIIRYKSKHDEYRDGLNKTELPWPIFIPGQITLAHVLDIFGELQMQRTTVTDKQPSLLKMLKTPVLLDTIQSPHGSMHESRLWNIACEGNEKLWTFGDDDKVCQIERSGLALNTFKVSVNVIGFAFDVLHALVFVVGWADTKIYKFECDRVVELLNLHSWLPRGLCHTANGDFLVSMLSTEKKRSRVVRYSGITEIQIIENDSKGKLLFSVENKSALHLTENGNGDICVADLAGNAVVVINSYGNFRLKYRGNTNTQSNFRDFVPSAIVNDKNNHLIINEDLKVKIHIIDSDGNFIRYIDYPCNGGISVDTDHNLVIGELTTGKIRIIKYLE